MKKIIAALVLTATATASMAQHYHGHRHYGHYWRPAPYAGWVLPAVIGGAIVYGATRPDTVVIQQPPSVVYQPTQSIVLPPPPAGYRWDSIVDSACNCTRFVLVAN